MCVCVCVCVCGVCVRCGVVCGGGVCVCVRCVGVLVPTFLAAKPRNRLCIDRQPDRNRRNCFRATKQRTYF